MGLRVPRAGWFPAPKTRAGFRGKSGQCWTGGGSGLSRVMRQGGAGSGSRQLRPAVASGGSTTMEAVVVATTVRWCGVGLSPSLVSFKRQDSDV